MDGSIQISTFMPILTFPTYLQAQYQTLTRSKSCQVRSFCTIPAHVFVALQPFRKLMTILFSFFRHEMAFTFSLVHFCNMVVGVKDEVRGVAGVAMVPRCVET